MTFQNYGPAGGMSTSEQPMSTTMCGVVPQNDSLNFGMERMFDDIEHPTSRLEAENRRLGAILEEQNKSVSPRSVCGSNRDTDGTYRRIQELEGQFDGFQEWTAQFSRLVNKMQLKLEGLSPLGKQFGYVMGSPSKKSKAQSRQKKPEPTASDGKRDLNTRRDSLAMLV